MTLKNLTKENGGQVTLYAQWMKEQEGTTGGDKQENSTEGGEEQETPTESKLSSIKITTDPSKTEYIVGEAFDSEGMVVTAVYEDGSEKTITGYTVDNGNSLKRSQTSVKISYIEGDITKTTTQRITVKPNENDTVYLVKGMKYKLDITDIMGTVGLKFRSGNNKIATVSSKGEVTGKGAGKTTIKAYNKAGYELDTWEVEVYTPKWGAIKKLPSYIPGDTFEASEFIAIPDTMQPIWESSNTSMIEIDRESGVAEIVATRAGSAKITVKFDNNQGKYMGYSTTVKVKVPVLSKKSITIQYGDTKLPVLTLKNVNVSKSEDVEWTVSSENLEISENGLSCTITDEFKYGECKVTATVNGKSYDCRVFVKEPMTNGKTVKLKAPTAIKPGSSTYLKVKNVKNVKNIVGLNWESSDEGVVIVDSYGKVTGVSAGNAEITVTICGKDLTFPVEVK